MSDYLPVPPENTGRRSKQVALVLLGTMGVVGGVVAWDAWQRAGAARADNTLVEQGGPPAAPVAVDRTYSNNEYIPGVGYYHAPYHAWYPHPFNYHDPARGYFGGGLWQAVPFIVTVMNSQANMAAIADARLAQQRYEQELRNRARPSYFNFGSSRRRYSDGPSFFSPSPSPSSPGSPRPTTAKPSTPSPSTSKPSSPSPSSSKPSIQRGGFGSSGHSSGGSGS